MMEGINCGLRIVEFGMRNSECGMSKKRKRKKSEVRGQRSEVRRQMTDDRRQMTEDRRQTTEDRGRKTVIVDSRHYALRLLRNSDCGMGIWECGLWNADLLGFIKFVLYTTRGIINT